MSHEPQADAVRRYLDEVFNRHDLDHLDRWLDSGLVSHWMGQETLHGLPAWRAAMSGFFAAFPDAAYTLADLVVAGDRAVWRGSWQATQRGTWDGVAASDRAVSWTVIIIARLADGRIAEDWVEYDRLGLFEQLGAVPLSGTRTS